MTTEGFYLQDYEYKGKFSAPMVYRLYTAPFLWDTTYEEGDTMRSTKELPRAHVRLNFYRGHFDGFSGPQPYFRYAHGRQEDCPNRNGRRAGALYFPSIGKSADRRAESIVNNDPDHAVSIHYPVSATKRSIYRFWR